MDAMSLEHFQSRVRSIFGTFTADVLAAQAALAASLGQMEQDAASLIKDNKSVCDAIFVEEASKSQKALS